MFTNIFLHHSALREFRLCRDSREGQATFQDIYPIKLSQCLFPSLGESIGMVLGSRGDKPMTSPHKPRKLVKNKMREIWGWRMAPQSIGVFASGRWIGYLAS